MQEPAIAEGSAKVGLRQSAQSGIDCCASRRIGQRFAISTYQASQARVEIALIL